MITETNMSGRVQRSHRDMYKANTPPWKDTYRKRCFERLRDSRDKLKAQFRKLSISRNNNQFIENLMKEEWESLRTEQENALEMDIEFGSLDFNIDQVLDMFEDIQAELRQEELRMLEEYESYEKSLQVEEQSLCSALDKLSTAEVVCPMCKKCNLLSNKSVIFCSCGLRINTEQDCLTLVNVKQMLESGLEAHAQGCQCEPVFTVVSETETTNLLMTCPDCDWMSVVI